MWFHDNPLQQVIFENSISKNQKDKEYILLYWSFIVQLTFQDHFKITTTKCKEKEQRTLRHIWERF